MQTGKRKVAILGGGMAGLAAAHELSKRDDLEITLYQLGWRLGGQCASGRNQTIANRIEEHGLHVWFGFYEQAFQMMKECYNELNRPSDMPISTFDQAFTPVNVLTMLEEVGGERFPWVVEFPTNLSHPGEDSCFDFTDVPLLMIKWIFEFWEGKPIDSIIEPNSHPQSLFELAESLIHHDIEQINFSDISAEAGFVWIRKAYEISCDISRQNLHGDRINYDLIIFLLKIFVYSRWWQVKKDVRSDNAVRRKWILFYLASTCLVGILRDQSMGRDFDSIDDYDLTDWFYENKIVNDDFANDVAYHSAPRQTVYDLMFHYEQGDTSKPSMAAGSALIMLLRMFLGYKGSVLWLMKEGMGETVVAPLYQALERRGVQFHFFHRVVNLELSEDQQAIGAIHMSRQVELTSGSYNPLVTMNSLPCWPSEPLFDQLVGGKELQEEMEHDKTINLEHAWSTWKDRGGELILRAGQDFDDVILAIGIGALPPLCSELVQINDRWKHMFEQIQTVQTQSLQLWFTPTSAQLGVPGQRLVVGAYVEPYSSLTDFSHLLKSENWQPPLCPQTLIYACGVLPDQPNENQVDADKRARNTALALLTHDAQPLWPKAVQPSNPRSLDWGVLTAPEQLVGEARFDAQYYRANVDPVERYVLSRPGSQAYRLKSEESGFDNLFLAGNWINTGFNLAFVETAVVSGQQAAQALLKRISETIQES